MSEANITNYQGVICAFCHNWLGNSNPRPNPSNPNIYEFDRDAEGKCTHTKSVKQAYLHCSCDKFERDNRIK